MKRLSVAALAALGCGHASIACAQDIDWASADGSLRASASVGVAFIRADEFVWEDTSKISHLIWETTAPVLSGEISYNFSETWTLSASGSFSGLGLGRGKMQDYDWNYDFIPEGEKANFSNWSDRSISEGKRVRLQHYLVADIALGYDIRPEQSPYQINLHSGFKYSDVFWKEYGGSHVYSWGGFRDEIGEEARELGITYRQQHVQAFAGATFSQQFERWTISGSVRGGITLMNTAHDFHVLRDQHFDEKMKTAPTLGLKAEIGYRWSDKAVIVGHASFDKIFQRRGDVSVNGDGGKDFNPNGGGAAFQAATVGLKVKYAF